MSGAAPGSSLLLGALCAAAAGWLLLAPRGPARLRRLGRAGSPDSPRAWTGRHRVHPQRSGQQRRWQRWRDGSPGRTLATVAVAVIALVLAVATGIGLLGSDAVVALPLTVTGAVGVSGALWLAARARQRSASRRRRAEVVEACEALASGLRAGLPPERVLARAAEDLPLLVPACSAARLGDDVAPALRTGAAEPGAERLAMLASAWEVARRSGAGLADVVSRIATMVRADAGRRRQVDAALGGARSTARLFAVLPVFGLALGAGMDADPVAVLTGTATGAWCLCIGTSLAVVGLVWVEWLAEAAAR